MIKRSIWLVDFRRSFQKSTWQRTQTAVPWWTFKSTETVPKLSGKNDPPLRHASVSLIIYVHPPKAEPSTHPSTHIYPHLCTNRNTHQFIFPPSRPLAIHPNLSIDISVETPVISSYPTTQNPALPPESVHRDASRYTHQPSLPSHHPKPFHQASMHQNPSSDIPLEIHP